MTPDPSIRFKAYLPPIQTAIMVSGDGDLLQVKLNVNLRISPEAARLLMVTGKQLDVTIVELTDIDNETEKDATSGAPELDKRRTDLRHHQ